MMRIPILQPIHPPIPPPRPLIKPGLIDRLRLASIGKLAQAQENNDDPPHRGCAMAKVLILVKEKGDKVAGVLGLYSDASA